MSSSSLNTKPKVVVEVISSSKDKLKLIMPLDSAVLYQRLTGRSERDPVSVHFIGSRSDVQMPLETVKMISQKSPNLLTSYSENDVMATFKIKDFGVPTNETLELDIKSAHMYFVASKKIAHPPKIVSPKTAPVSPAPASTSLMFIKSSASNPPLPATLPVQVSVSCVSAVSPVEKPQVFSEKPIVFSVSDTKVQPLPTDPNTAVSANDPTTVLSGESESGGLEPGGPAIDPKVNSKDGMVKKHDCGKSDNKFNGKSIDDTDEDEDSENTMGFSDDFWESEDEEEEEEYFVEERSSSEENTSGEENIVKSTSECLQAHSECPQAHSAAPVVVVENEMITKIQKDLIELGIKTISKIIKHFLPLDVFFGNRIAQVKHLDQKNKDGFRELFGKLIKVDFFDSNNKLNNRIKTVVQLHDYEKITAYQACKIWCSLVWNKNDKPNKTTAPRKKMSMWREIKFFTNKKIHSLGGNQRIWKKKNCSLSAWKNYKPCPCFIPQHFRDSLSFYNRFGTKVAGEEVLYWILAFISKFKEIPYRNNLSQDLDNLEIQHMELQIKNQISSFSFNSLKLYLDNVVFPCSSPQTNQNKRQRVK